MLFGRYVVALFSSSPPILGGVAIGRGGFFKQGLLKADVVKLFGQPPPYPLLIKEGSYTMGEVPPLRLRSHQGYP